jgi:Phage tail protein
MVSIGQYSYRGLTFGRGTPYPVPGRNGLLDLPDIRTSDANKLRRDGVWPGDDFAGAKSFVLSGHIDAEMSASSGLDVLLNAFTSAMTHGKEDALTFWLPGIYGGQQRRILVRPRKRTLNIDEATRGWASWAVEFHASDPRIYEEAINQATSVLPTAGGGLQFSLRFPLVFGAVSTGGSIFAVNNGTAPTPIWARIDGPCANPVLILANTGEYLAFNMSIQAGDWLEVDFANHTALLNGTSSRFSTITNQGWWLLLPGNNEIQFRASTQTSALLTVKWSSAWM